MFLEIEKKIAAKAKQQEKKDTSSDLLFSATNNDIPIDQSGFSISASSTNQEIDDDHVTIDENELKEKDSFQRFLDNQT